MKPQEQIAAFEAHAKAVYKDFKRDITILKPLFEHLDRQQKEKPEKLTKEKLEGLLKEDPKNPQKGKDKNEKQDAYASAFGELVRVWGTAEAYKRPSPAQEHIAAFETNVKAHYKMFNKSKSVLKPLFEHLDKVKDKTGEKLNKDDVLKMLTKGDDRKKTYYACIHELIRVWGTTELYKPVEPPPKVSPWNFAFRSGPALLKWMKGYTLVLDNPKDPIHVAAFKLLKRSSAWNAAEYKKVFDQLEKHKQGTFAMYTFAAAHLLTFNQADGPQVEIVAWKAKQAKEYGHSFVLVGREGPDAAEKVPPWKNQDDLIIVDGCFGPRGNDVAFKGSGNYPSAMTDDLDRIAVWPPEKPDDDD